MLRNLRLYLFSFFFFSMPAYGSFEYGLDIFPLDVHVGDLESSFWSQLTNDFNQILYSIRKALEEKQLREEKLKEERNRRVNAFFMNLSNLSEGIYEFLTHANVDRTHIIFHKNHAKKKRLMRTQTLSRLNTYNNQLNSLEIEFEEIRYFMSLDQFVKRKNEIDSLHLLISNCMNIYGPL